MTEMHVWKKKQSVAVKCVFLYFFFLSLYCEREFFSFLCCELCVLLNKGIEKDFQYGQLE